MYSRQAAIASGPGRLAVARDDVQRLERGHAVEEREPVLRREAAREVQVAVHADQVAGEQHALGREPDDRVAGGVRGAELDRDGVRRGRARR